MHAGMPALRPPSPAGNVPVSVPPRWAVARLLPTRSAAYRSAPHAVEVLAGASLLRARTDRQAVSAHLSALITI